MTRRLILALALWLLPTLALAQPAYVDSTSCIDTSMPSSTFTCAFTVSGGSDRALLVSTGHFNSSAPTCSGITYNGIALTELVDVTASGTGRVCLYGMDPDDVPTAGAYNAVVTFSGSADDHFMCVAEFTGVDGTTPFNTPNSATGDSTTASVTATTAADEIIFAGMANGWNNATPGANETERQDVDVIAGNLSHWCATQAGSDGGAITPTRTAAGATNLWLIGAVSIKPVSVGGGSTACQNLLLLGVGGTCD